MSVHLEMCMINVTLAFIREKKNLPAHLLAINSLSVMTASSAN